MIMLFNHVAVFNDYKKMPIRYYLIRHLIINGEKMSKSKGNLKKNNRIYQH